jgi:hypothetical protein
MRNKIVVRYANGKMKKGSTEDFFPNKESFHMHDKDNGELQEVAIKDLKAVFFVKSFEGNPSYHESFDIERVGLGKRIMVHFKDNEKMVGYTTGYSPNRSGFILFPCDPVCNNEKVYVITTATNKIEFL